MIPAATDFSSQHYLPITWHDIFEKTCTLMSGPVSIDGLLNKNNFAWLRSACDGNEITLFGNAHTLHAIHFSELQSIPGQFFQNQAIPLYQLKNTNHGVQKNSASVNGTLFLSALAQEIQMACQQIFLYTHEHLSNRYYDGIKMSQLEVVHANIADIVILLTKMGTCPLDHLDDIHFVLSQYAIILKLLSRLAGARAVLKGNALELLFYLNFFLRFSQEM